MQHGEQSSRRFRSRLAAAAAVAGLAVVTAACGSATPGQPAGGAMAEHGAQGTVAFVQPKEGATLKSPVHFEFSSEHITISPVPQGTIEHPREGMGHYHLGVDTDCLPPGTDIPKGTPGWVHFGKGDNSMDMQLTPGPHKFSLQVGDDQHKTIAGLCQSISITVE